MTTATFVLYLVGILAATAIAVVVFKLDEIHSRTGLSPWRLVNERWLQNRTQTSSPGVVDAAVNRGAALVLALVPLLLLAGVVVTGLWLSPPTDDANTATSTFVAPAAESATTAAVALSQNVYPEGEADNVLLTRALPSVDALVAGGLQGLLDGPLLLTTSEELSPETADEIDRLGRPSVHILGGEQAVSSAIEEQLVAAGHDVHRHAGATGAETAIDIASRHFPDAEDAILAPTFGINVDSTEILARSLTAGGLAAARQVPILLTDSDTLSSSTADYLRQSGISSVLVVGSQVEIGSPVMKDLAELGLTATRLGGEDRYATAVAVARAEGFATETGDDVVLLAEGAEDTMWPGISIAAVYAGRENAPIVLSAGGELPAATREYLRARADGPRLICMPGVASSACEQARIELAGSRGN